MFPLWRNAAYGLMPQYLFFGILASMLLTACSGAPKHMRLDQVVQTKADKWPVWPKPPELPRYAYVGELIGESNYKATAEELAESAKGFFAILVGLGKDKPIPIVLQRPLSGVSDDQGRIYVTDVSRQAVFVFDEAASELQLWEMATSTKPFMSPNGVALGRNRELLVTDAEMGVVVRLDQQGKPLGSFGKDVLVRPTGIARNSSTGHIYVADTRSNDIKVFTDDGKLLEIWGHEGDAPGFFNAPTYLTYANDQLYVTDALNARVQVLNKDGGLVRYFGKRGLYLGELTRPKGVAVDSEGRVYVVESYYDHLLIFDRDGQFLLPIGGSGHAPGQFYLPAGAWVDSQGKVFVADMFNGRVSIFQFLGGDE